MAKSKEGRGSDEYYLGIIRKLKSENRNLKKKIKQLSKREHFYEDDNDDDIPELPSGQANAKLKELCESCGKGFLEEIEIIGRYFKKCNICEFRTKAIKL